MRQEPHRIEQVDVYKDNLLNADRDNAMSTIEANSTGLTTDQLHASGITLDSDLMKKARYDATTGQYLKKRKGKEEAVKTNRRNRHTNICTVC